MTGESNAKGGGEEVVYGNDAPISWDESTHTLTITLPKNIKKILGYEAFAMATYVGDSGYKDMSQEYCAPATSGPPEEKCRLTTEAPSPTGGVWRDPCDVTISGNKIMIAVPDWSVTYTDTVAAYTYIPE